MAYSVTDGRGPDVLAVSGAMIALSTIAVGLRIWGRFVGRKSGLWWDDWLSLAALPFIWAICALSIHWVYLGLGQHFVRVHTPHAKLGFVLFVVDFVYNTGLTLVKLSVLMFYARVFGIVRASRIAFWIVGVMLVAWCIAIDFVALFACIPIQKSWDSSVPGHCRDRQTNFIGAAIPNIVTDFILLILPVPLLWHLQTSVRRKIGLIGVFAAGYLVLVLSILRFVYIDRDGTNVNKDLTWNSVNSIMLLVCEVSIALISSCIPTIFNLIKHAAGNGFLRRLSKSGSPNEAGGGTANLCLGIVNDKLQASRESGFDQLECPQNIPGASNERLFRNTHRAFSDTLRDSETV